MSEPPSSPPDLDRDLSHVLRERVLAFVTVLPPPTTGQTTVSQAMFEAFQGFVEVRDLSIRKNTALRRRFWCIAKHVLLLRNVLRVLGRRPADDCIYLVPDSGWGMLGSCVLVFLARLRCVPVLAHHHVFAYCKNRRLLAALFFAMAGERCLHVVLGARMADAIHSQYGDHIRTMVISNRNFFFRSSLADRPWPSKVRRVGYLSNITIAKGIREFLDLGRLSTEADVEFVIAGPIREPGLETEVREFVDALPSRRRYVGAVYEGEKEEFFANIDLLAFPTKYANEAEPLVVYEALSRGVPALATSRGCIPDQLPVEWIAPDEDNFAPWAAERIKAWPERCRDDWLAYFQPTGPRGAERLVKGAIDEAISAID